MKETFMEEWKTYKLGDIASVQTGPFGSQLHNEDYVSVGTPIVTVEHLGARKFSKQNLPLVSEEDKDRLSKYSLQEGDIVFSRVGSVDRCSYVSHDEDGWLFSGRCLRVRSGNLVYPLFLYYYFQKESVKQEIRNVAVGATMPSINTKLLSDLTVILPPITEQKRIAGILSSIDDKIELNNRINHNLEEQARALYKSWFVDFEPFKDGKFIDSEIGMIPEGWRIYKFTDIASICSGYSYKGSELIDSDCAMATIKNFDRDGSFKIEGYKEIRPSGRLKHEQIVGIYDVLVAHTDLTQKAEIIGSPAIILSSSGYKKLIMSMDLCKVTSTITNISQGLLYYLLKSSSFKQHALGYVNGTTVLHLSKKALLDFTIALPDDLSELDVISKLLMEKCKLMSSLLNEEIILQSIRDALLPKLMSGSITC